MKDRYFVYSDASFDKKNQFAVTGFYIFDNSLMHDAVITDVSLIQIQQFTELNNIRAELRGAITALQILEKKIQSNKKNNDFIVTLYTDCQTLVSLNGRRKKLEASQYISKKTKQIIANADLYKAFFLIYDQLKFKMVWIKGHSPSKKQTMIHKNFSLIDRMVRKKLRNSFSEAS